MRVVSWTVVFGSALWLFLYYFGETLLDRDLPGIPPDAVSGTVNPDAGRAQWSFSELYPLLEHSREDGHGTLVVRSRLPGVAPGDIVFTLEDGGERFRFTPDDRGRVTLPLSERWRDRSLALRSNQPAGSLALEPATRNGLDVPLVDHGSRRDG